MLWGHRVSQGTASFEDHSTALLVRLALEQMKLKEVLQGKAGIGGKNKKDTVGHKVRTRPPI